MLVSLPPNQTCYLAIGLGNCRGNSALPFHLELSVVRRDARRDALVTEPEAPFVRFVSHGLAPGGVENCSLALPVPPRSAIRGTLLPVRNRVKGRSGAAGKL
jgi:hypothetical protein